MKRSCAVPVFVGRRLDQNLSRKVAALLCGIVILGCVAAIPAAAATADCPTCDEVTVNAASLPRDGLIKVKTLPENYALYAFMKAGQMKDIVVKDSAGRVCQSLDSMSSSTSSIPTRAKAGFRLFCWKKCIRLGSFGKKCFKVCDWVNASGK